MAIASALCSSARAQAPTPSQSPSTSAPANADSSTGTTVGEVIVTAQKRSENIDKVPLSIQAFSGQALQNAGITDPSGLTQVVPGLTFSRSSANTPIYTLRGVGFNTPNLSSTSPVGIYVDEVAYAYPFMSNGPLYDIERVEVLKGPQGTLYGRNTTGGLINFITGQPTQHPEASLTGEIGNYDTYNAEGFVNLPVSSTLSVRLAGRTENSGEGWQDSISRDDRLGKKDRLAFRGTALWTPDPKLTVELTGSYWRDKSDTVATQAIVYRPEQAAFAIPGLAQAVRTNWTGSEADWDPTSDGSPRPKSNDQFYSGAARVTYKLDDTYSFVSLTGYNHVDRDDYNDLDGTQYPVFGYLSTGSISSFSQEVRGVANFSRVSAIAGAYYSYDRITDNQVGYYSGSSTGNLLQYLAQNVIDPTNQLYSAQQYANGFDNYRNNLQERDRSASVFANADWSVTDKLKLTGGVRYTDDKLEYSDCSRDYNGDTLPIWNTSVHALVSMATGAPPAPPVTPNGCLAYTADFTAIAPYQKPTLEQSNVGGRISAQYSLTNNSLEYVTISRGYKSGVVPVLPANVTTQFDPARQESVTAFEVGTKTSFLDRRLRTTLAGYYYDYNNKQVFSEVPDLVFTALKRIVNVPESRVFGFEGDANFQITSNLQVNGGFSYTNSDITKFVGYNTLGQQQNFASSPFPYTPTWQLNGAINYNRPVTSRFGVDGGLEVSYQSYETAALSNDPGLYVAPYALVNGTLGVYQLDHAWRATLFVRNLFNTYYWTDADVATDTVFRVPGMTRTFGLRLTYDFR